VRKRSLQRAEFRDDGRATARPAHGAICRRWLRFLRPGRQSLSAALNAVSPFFHATRPAPWPLPAALLKAPSAARGVCYSSG
jgi:hypothetical protein